MHTHTKICAFCHFPNLSHVYRVCFILHKNNKTKTKLWKRSWCRQLRTAVGIINVYHLSAFCMLYYIPKCFYAQDHLNCFHFNSFPVWKWSNASTQIKQSTNYCFHSHISHHISNWKVFNFVYLILFLNPSKAFFFKWKSRST